MSQVCFLLQWMRINVWWHRGCNKCADASLSWLAPLIFQGYSFHTTSSNKPSPEAKLCSCPNSLNGFLHCIHCSLYLFNYVFEKIISFIYFWLRWVLVAVWAFLQLQRAGGYSPVVRFSSAAQSCLTLCDPMDCSTPGLPVHHQLLELTQTHVHWVGDGNSLVAVHVFSLPWLLLLWRTGSRAQTQWLWPTGLVCSTACGIFLDQGWNPGLLHWQADSLPRSHQGSPIQLLLDFPALLCISPARSEAPWREGLSILTTQPQGKTQLCLF